MGIGGWTSELKAKAMMFQTLEKRKGGPLLKIFWKIFLLYFRIGKNSL